MLAVIASAYLFDRLVRDRWGDSARWATLWFAAGVVTLLADGQLTFALGVAFGLATLRALQRGRAAPALAAGRGLRALEPGRRRLPRRRPGRRRRSSSRAGARRLEHARAIQVACLALRPRPDPEPRLPRTRASSPSSSPPSSRSRSGAASALFLTRRLGDEERQLRQVLLGYVLAATALWLLPNAMGGNAVRLGALFGGPVLAAVLLARRPRAAVLVRRALPRRQPLLAAERERHPDRPQRRRPSTKAAYFEPLAHWLRDHGGRGARVEVPPTANHWESAYLAPEVELARGWLRQIDTTRDDIFYDDDGELDQRQLPGLAARQRGPVRRPPRRPARLLLGAERRLILSEPPYLRLRWQQPPLARLHRARPRAAGRARGGGRGTRPPGRPPGLHPRRRPPPATSWSGSTSPPTGRSPAARLPPPPRRVDRWPAPKAPGIFHVGADFSLARAWNAVTGAHKTC